MLDENITYFEKQARIYPRSVKGRYRRLKWAAIAVLLGIYYATPWLRWHRGENLPDQATLKLGFSQSELASIVGATRPKVNRALQDIMATGALRREGDALVCNTPALLDLVAEYDDLG